MTISYQQFKPGAKISYKGMHGTVVSAYLDERYAHPENSVPVVLDEGPGMTLLIKETELTKA